MPYVPPHIRRAAAEAGVTVEEFLAAKAAANAEEAERRRPRNVGIVARHEPGGEGAGGVGGGIARRHSSSSNRRRRTRRIQHSGRRVRVNLNTGHGVNEVHPPHVEPNEVHNTRGAAYRVERHSPALANAAAMEAYAQRIRRKTLANVMATRAEVVGGNAATLAAINAALSDLSARAALNASNAVAIASIGQQLKDLLDGTE